MATVNHLPEPLTCQTVACDAAATLARVASARLAARAAQCRAEAWLCLYRADEASDTGDDALAAAWMAERERLLATADVLDAGGAA